MAWTAAGALTAFASSALAQTAPPAPTPAPAPSAAAPAPTEVEAVVVNAAAAPYRTQPGAVVGDIEPELQLDPEEVQSYGVSTVSELLDELAPLTRSDAGRGGETPVVLLNGKRISGFGEVRDIPTEAILRVDVLPEEAALKYGFTADQRVVNFVLRPRFRSLTGQATVGAPTAGGQVNGALQAGRFGVRGDDRVNLDLKLSGASDLTYAARGLDGRASGQPYALAGNVTAGAGRGEIDPALSALAGRPVTVAGVPAAGRAPSLADFAANGAAANVDDLGRERDLAPATGNLTANLVAARALGGGWSGTLNGSLTAGDTLSLQGLAPVAVTLPAGTPFSPFASNVRLYRYVAGAALRQHTSTWSGHLGATLNRQAGEWRFNLTGAYDHADTLVKTGSGFGAAPLQALLDAGDPAADPYGPIAAAWLVRLPASEARSLSDTANVQALVNGPLLKVPAGQLTASLKLRDSQSNFAARSFRFGSAQAVSLSRNELNAQADLDLPLTSRRNPVLPQLGELSLNLNASIDRVSDFGTLHSLGYGLNWRPVRQLRLIVSHTRDESAPSVSQLGGPTVLTPGVRLYDFAAGQTVDVVQVGGGNRALRGDVRNVFKGRLNVRPWQEQRFNFSVNYVDQRTDHPISTFPAATAAIEAAFPDRFVRDASGELVQVDQRPVNFAWTRRQDVRWGFNYSRRLGRQAERGAAREGRAGRGRFDGRGRGGDGGQGRFQIAAFHTVYFVDRTLVRPGGPLLDLLGGSPSGRTGGQPVHAVEGQLGYTRSGLGLRVNANWVEGTTVQGGALSADSLAFSDLTTVHLRLFADFAQVPGLARAHPWLSGSRLTIGVFNLFDQRLRVRDQAGVTPLGYQPALLDPTGRQFAVTFRKVLF